MNIHIAKSASNNNNNNTHNDSVFEEVWDWLIEL